MGFQALTLQKLLKNAFSHIDGSQIEKSAFPKHDVNGKVVDNHLINNSGKFEAFILKTFRQKSLFGPWAYLGLAWGCP